MIRDVRDRPIEMLLPKAEEFMGDVYDEWVEKNLKTDERQAIDQINKYFKKEMVDEDTDRDKLLMYFLATRFKVVSIALTREQIDQYNPPPNPAKRTDPRSAKFIEAHGDESWGS